MGKTKLLVREVFRGGRSLEELIVPLTSSSSGTLTVLCASDIMKVVKPYPTDREKQYRIIFRDK